MPNGALPLMFKKRESDVTEREGKTNLKATTSDGRSKRW